MVFRRFLDNRHWTGFSSALQFLTIMPFGRHPAFDARASLPFYPLCGLLIGAILACVHQGALLLWPPQVTALLDVVALVVITGALHLDGLADTADGLYGRRDPQRALAIMKDSRIGSMGSVSLICCLAAKWAGLSHISGDEINWLFLVPAYARASVLFGIKALPYGRPDGGTGRIFFQAPIRIRDFWGLGLLILLSLFTGWGFLALNMGFALIVFAALWWYKKKLQCITGDMLGAMIETVEAGLFIIAAAQWGV